MIDARPAAFVRYMREAYEPPNTNEVRLTFDRFLQAGPYRGELSLKGMESWPRPYIDGVVLEMKFTDRFPHWMHECCQRFNLWRSSFAKYVRCVSVLDDSPVAWMAQMGGWTPRSPRFVAIENNVGQPVVGAINGETGPTNGEAIGQSSGAPNKVAV
jgi:hypothetical protein